MDADLILQGERYVTLAHAEAAVTSKDVVLDAIGEVLQEAGYNLPLQEQVGAVIIDRNKFRTELRVAQSRVEELGKRLADANAESEERRDALRNLLCEGHDADDYKHTPDNTGCVLCDLKQWEETMKGMSANLAEARATKDMRKERRQQAEALIDELLDRLAEADGDTAANAAAAVSAPRFDFEADEQRIAALENWNAHLDQRVQDLERRQTALDGEISGWREMVNGLRYSINELNQAVDALLEGHAILKDRLRKLGANP